MILPSSMFPIGGVLAGTNEYPNLIESKIVLIQNRLYYVQMGVSRGNDSAWNGHNDLWVCTSNSL